MGCFESKEPVNKIKVASVKEKLEVSVKNLEKDHSAASSTSSGMGSSASTNSSGKQWSSASSTSRIVSSDRNLKIKCIELDSDEEGDDIMGELPTTILDAIPNNDLGESLDAIRLRQMFTRSSATDVTSSGRNGSSSRRHWDVTNAMSAHHLSSAKSEESSDSGIYDLEDDYSFVITEMSCQEKIHLVEKDFTPIEHLDLTVTGRACARLLSGSQRARQQEAEILQNLRDEGFITTSKQKSGGGLSFEVMEATPLAESASGKIKPKEYLPKGHKQNLDAHRSKYHLQNLTTADIERKQYLAEERRKDKLDSKVEKLSSLNKTTTAEDQKIEEMKRKKEQKDEAALEKRETHLRDLRDKLKAKNKKIQQIKLKKMINAPPIPVPIAPSFQMKQNAQDDEFF